MLPQPTSPDETSRRRAPSSARERVRKRRFNKRESLPQRLAEEVAYRMERDGRAYAAGPLTEPIKDQARKEAARRAGS